MYSTKQLWEMIVPHIQTIPLSRTELIEKGISKGNVINGINYGLANGLAKESYTKVRLKSKVCVVHTKYSLTNQ